MSPLDAGAGHCWTCAGVLLVAMATSYGELGMVNGTAKFIQRNGGCRKDRCLRGFGFGLTAFLMTAMILALLRVGSD